MRLTGIMDEHKLRLRFENGLSTSRGENTVRRVNKRLRIALYSPSKKERRDAGHGLLRDQETLREVVLVQQLRAEKVAKQNVKGAAIRADQRRKECEAELREKRRFFEDVAAKLPKVEGTEMSKELLLPVANCEAQLAQLKKREAELDALILQQGNDFLKWREMAARAEASLSGEMDETDSDLDLTNHASHFVEPPEETDSKNKSPCCLENACHVCCG